MSSFCLVFRKACRLLVELEHKTYWATYALNIDIQEGGTLSNLQLTELEEIHNDACNSSKRFKARTKAYHDKMIIQKDLKPG